MFKGWNMEEIIQEDTGEAGAENAAEAYEEPDMPSAAQLHAELDVHR